MVNSNRGWLSRGVQKGVETIRMQSWRRFQDFLSERLAHTNRLIWRGQRDADWHLEPSFKRIQRIRKLNDPEWSAKFHLTRFKKSAIGKLNSEKLDFTGSERQRENEWWAIGQHYDLATPLLDWTFSPFVALYFAFEKEEEPASSKRSIWALYPDKLRKLKAAESDEFGFELVTPKFNENQRIISQSGVLTRINLEYSLEEWVETAAGGQSEEIYLTKIILPSSSQRRKECLCMLNQMNINALTLFPDIYGASRRCNMAAEIGGTEYFPLIGGELPKKKQK